MAAPVKSSPKDAQVMSSLLKEMGVSEYEPRVINQMLECTYRYVTDVLDDSKVYSSHAGKKSIDADDIKLAIQCRMDHSYTTPPPRDLLMDLARHRNNQNLPLIKPYTGPKLPPDRYCLSSQNYKMRSIKKSRIHIGLPLSTAQNLAAGGRIPMSLGGSGTLQLVTRGVTQPTVTLVSKQDGSHSTIPSPSIRINPGTTQVTSISLPRPAVDKIKKEEDDYDM